MARAILIILAVLFLGLSAIAIVYVLGIRSKCSMVRNAARHFHRAVGNPLQMRWAGTPRTKASVLRHRGRATGRIYETPVWAAPTEDGFVIAIVYGSRTDWLKNVLASGAAVIVRGRDTYRVERPEIVPMESARAYFSAPLQRIHRLIRVDRCLRVRRVEVANTLAPQGSSYPEQAWMGWTAVNAHAATIGAAASMNRMDRLKEARRRR
jgi:deazaflavin-dependent oxidoreductase (nitroreductase family)